MDYGHLREQYPAVISKDQLYRICHISKRKALWLLEHGVIPCEDSGKQTRRFRIQLEAIFWNGGMLLQRQTFRTGSSRVSRLPSTA